MKETRYKKFIRAIIIITQIVLSLIMVRSIFKIIICSVYYNFKPIVHFTLVGLSTLGILVNIIFYGIRSKKIEKMFLMIVIPLGMIFLFLQLPSYKPDEPYHLYKSYAIATGDFIHERNEQGVSQIKVPKDMAELNGLRVDNYKKMEEVLFKKCDYNDTQVVASTAANYTPIAYVFSSIGILIGKFLNLSIFSTIFLSRLANYIFYVIIGYWSIKKIPMGKFIMLLLLLSPMMLQQSTAVTADIIMNSLSLFFIAYLLYVKFEKKKINYLDLSILLACIVIISLIKIVYIPLIIVLICLLWKELKNNKKLIIPIAIAALICILAYLLLSRIYSYRNEEAFVNPLVNGKEQIKFVISHPFSYIMALSNTFFNWGSMYATSMVGDYLAWYDLKYNGFMMIFYLILLVLATLENSKYELRKGEKAITLITFFLIFNIMFLGIYIQWNSVGADSIAGIQGRYFIPFVLLLLVPILSKKNNIEILEKNPWIYPLCIIVSNICVIYNMIPKYF